MNTVEIRLAVLQSSLLEPGLSCHERRSEALAIASRCGCSEHTVYRHRKRALQGLPARKERSDKGGARALPKEVLEALADLTRRLPSASYSTFWTVLQRAFPEVPLTYGTVRFHARALLKQHDPVRTPTLPVWSPSRLRFALTSAGLDGPQAARAVGLSPRELDLILSGGWVPPASLLPALAALCGVGLADLFAEGVGSGEQ